MKFKKSNWESKHVSDLFKIETGSTPSTKCSEYWRGGTINWITPTDLSYNEGKVYVSGSERKVTSKALDENNLTLLPKGSLILSTRAPVGYTAILETAGVFNQGCKGLVPRMGLSSEFYYYCLIAQKKLLENRSSGSTFKELATDMLEKVVLPFPPLSEQKRVVEILSTVDGRIEKTKQKINAAEKIKEGLLRQIFAERYLGKNTGSKENWVESNFGEIGCFQYGYTASSTSENTGIQFLRITDISESGTIDWDRVPFCRISKDSFNDYRLSKGDLLFARLGATAGKTALVESDKNAVFASYLIRFRANNWILPKYVFYFTQSNLYWGQAVRHREGQLKKGLNATMLGQLEITYPKAKHDQVKVVEILSEIDMRIENEKAQKEKLLRVRKSLLNSLLFD